MTRAERKERTRRRQLEIQDQILTAMKATLEAGHGLKVATRAADMLLQELIDREPQEAALIRQAGRELAEILEDQFAAALAAEKVEEPA